MFCLSHSTCWVTMVMTVCMKAFNKLLKFNLKINQGKSTAESYITKTLFMISDGIPLNRNRYGKAISSGTWQGQCLHMWSYLIFSIKDIKDVTMLHLGEADRVTVYMPGILGQLNIQMVGLPFHKHLHPTTIFHKLFYISHLMSLTSYV